MSHTRLLFAAVLLSGAIKTPAAEGKPSKFVEVSEIQQLVWYIM